MTALIVLAAMASFVWLVVVMSRSTRADRRYSSLGDGSMMFVDGGGSSGSDCSPGDAGCDGGGDGGGGGD